MMLAERERVSSVPVCRSGATEPPDFDDQRGCLSVGAIFIDASQRTLTEVFRASRNLTELRHIIV